MHVLSDKKKSAMMAQNSENTLKLGTVAPRLLHTPSREERRFLNFNHLSKEFLEQMIPHLKALI